MEVLKNGDWRFEDAEELKSVVDAFISQNHSGVSVESAPNDAEFLYQIETVLIYNDVEGNEYDQSQLEMRLYWDG